MNEVVSMVVAQITALRLPPTSGYVTGAYRYTDDMKKYDECLSRLVAVPPGDSGDLVDVLLHHENVDVRYAAAVALKALVPRLDAADRPRVRAALEQALTDNGQHVVDLDYQFWEDLSEEWQLYGPASNSIYWGASVPKTVQVSQVARESLELLGAI